MGRWKEVRLKGLPKRDKYKWKEGEVGRRVMFGNL